MVSKRQEMFIDAADLNDSEKLEIKYVRVKTAPLWDQNPKLHDIGSIVESIENNGFRDPAAWDNTLGAIVAGNGRTECLQIMEKQGKSAPRGILTDGGGDWYMPVLFGIDSESQAAAVRYAVDHNNLTMMGGDFSLFDVTKMWDKDGYISVLQGLKEADADFPITVDMSDMETIASYFKDGDEADEAVDGDGDNDKPNSSAAKSEDSSHSDSAVSNNSNTGDNDSLNETQSHGAVVSIVLTNEILAEDVTEILEALVDEHPEWEATVKLKYFKPESSYN